MKKKRNMRRGGGRTGRWKRSKRRKRRRQNKNRGISRERREPEKFEK